MNRATIRARLLAQDKANKRAQEHRELSRYYNINSILGNQWAMIFGIIGARKTGKSYAITQYICRRKKKLKNQCKVYWMRISTLSTKAMLENQADKLVDPDLKRKYDLKFTTKGMTVYDHYDKEKKDENDPFIVVAPLASFGKLKGVGFYDKDFTGEYILVLDEFQLEEGEKRTSFDILYNFIGMCENIARTTKNNIKVFLLGNTLEEASTIFKALNFIPEKFGRFYLRSKRAVIDNLEPTEEYFKDRKGSIADVLGGDAMSNFTNEMKKDIALINKSRTKHPTAIIKFSKDCKDWFTLWDGIIIKKYNGEHLDKSTDFAMRPRLDTYYSRERAMNIIEMYDARALNYNTYITKAFFEDALAKVRKM